MDQGDATGAVQGEKAECMRRGQIGEGERRNSASHRNVPFVRRTPKALAVSARRQAPPQRASPAPPWRVGVPPRPWAKPPGSHRGANVESPWSVSLRMRSDGKTRGRPAIGHCCPEVRRLIETSGTPPAPAIRRQIDYPDAQPVAGSHAGPEAGSSSGVVSTLVPAAQIAYRVAG